jgi:hypothetical protein
MPKRRAPMATFYIAGSFYTVGDFLTFRRVVSTPHPFFVFNHVFNHEAILWTHEKNPHCVLKPKIIGPTLGFFDFHM